MPHKEAQWLLLILAVSPPSIPILHSFGLTARSVTSASVCMTLRKLECLTQSTSRPIGDCCESYRPRLTANCFKLSMSGRCRKQLNGAKSEGHGRNGSKAKIRPQKLEKLFRIKRAAAQN